MVGIPPIKMVMNRGWCKWHCYTHINMDQFLGITGSCVCDIDMENPCAWLALPGYKVPTQMPNMFLYLLGKNGHSYWAPRWLPIWGSASSVFSKSDFGLCMLIGSRTFPSKNMVTASHFSPKMIVGDQEVD